MAAKTARRRSWAALGAVLAALGPLLAPLWAVLALPGGPREAPGGAPGGHFGVFFDGPAPEAEKSYPQVRVLALIFAFFLLAWHAPGQAANIDKS